MSEIEFLKGEAAAARQAMSQSLRRAQTHAESNSKLSEWTNAHPWLTTGAAAGAGLLVGSLVSARVKSGSPVAGGTEPASAGGGLGAWLKPILAGPLTEVLQTVITIAMAALVGSAPASAPTNKE